MTTAVREGANFVITIDRRWTIGAVVGAIVVVFGFGWNASTASGRIDRLEENVKPMAQINERTIRIEEQVNAIRAQLDRRH